MIENQVCEIKNALYIVPTPIGNLSDITLRALDVLRNVDVVICEDSRVTNKLLSHYEIKNKSFFKYNDNSGLEARKKILHFLMQKKSVALLSDAGTPLISDPGHKLIDFLREFKQEIIPLPGACSLITAISASGIAADNFSFIGFLPTSKIAKKNTIKSQPNITFAFFESPNRILETLEILKLELGNRKICVAKELTKIHEEFITDDVENVLDYLKNNESKVKGEFVVIVSRADKNVQNIDEEELKEIIKKEIESGKSLKDLSKDLSEIYELNKKHIYQLALNLS